MRKYFGDFREGFGWNGYWRIGSQNIHPEELIKNESKFDWVTCDIEDCDPSPPHDRLFPKYGEMLSFVYINSKEEMDEIVFTKTGDLK